jgi:hypothetical protein
VQVSVAGVLVCAALLLIGRQLGSTILIALFGSLAFGSTSIATLSALGGASPPIYTIFVLLLIVSLFLRRTFFADLAATFRDNTTMWVLSALAVYAVAGAVIFPRLFAGSTSVFVTSRTDLRVNEVLLAPVSGNLTQTAFYLLGALACVSLTALFHRNVPWNTLRRGLFTWAVLSAALGIIDLGGKLAGAGDVLAPIRTGSFAMATDSDQAVAGFFRISGGHSEASAFASATLPCLAFAFTYWRATRSQAVFALAATLFALLILSTSSTAYVACGLMAIPLVASLLTATVTGRLRHHDLALIALVCMAGAACLAVYLHSDRAFDSFSRLMDMMLFNKASSTSAVERSLWNTKSLASLWDTAGFGIGIGSSRTSSWMIAVVSQLGILGAILQTYLVIALFRPSADMTHDRRRGDPAVIISSVRAAALAALVAASISSSTPDPGLLFFIALAILTASRQREMRPTTNAFRFSPATAGAR